MLRELKDLLTICIMGVVIMINAERNINKLVAIIQKSDDCSDFLKLAGGVCSNISCEECQEILKKLLINDYKESNIDWSKVKEDAKIYVWNGICKCKYCAYFKGLSDNGKIQAYKNGATSWTSKGKYDEWDYAELVGE